MSVLNFEDKDDELEQSEYVIDDEEDLNDETEKNEATLKVEGRLSLKDISNYINSLRQLIPYWYDLYFPEQSVFLDNIKLWLGKLNRIGYAYFKPLTCVVLAKNDIDENNKIEYLKLVERWIFLLFRLSGYFETYKNSSFYNMANSLYRTRKSIGVINEELNDIAILSKDGKIYIDAPLSKMTRMFKNQDGYYSWKTMRYFLYEYELFLKGKTGTDIKLTPEAIFKKDTNDKISVEHIFPQNPDNAYWLERFGKYTDTSLHFITNSIGNLLPLSMAINSSFQNESFISKKEGKNNRERCYHNGCYSEMEVAKYDDWNIDTITQRGRELLDFMARRYRFEFASEIDRDKMLFLADIEIDKNKVIDLPLKEIKDIMEEVAELSKKSNENVIRLFKELHNFIVSLNDSITYSVTKHYISYSLGKCFAEIHFMSDFIKMYIMTGKYNDPKCKVEKLGENYNWTNDNRIDINDFNEMEYVKDIIKQSFEKVI